MNQTEAGYALELEARKIAGEIRWYAFEPLKLKLADGEPGSIAKGAYYKPDFILWMADGSMQAHECKGRWEEAAKVRFKVARDRYRWLKFFAVTKHKGKYEVRG